MKCKNTTFRELKSVIKAELSDITALQDKMEEEYLDKNSKAHRRAKGSVLQDFYKASKSRQQYQ